MFLNSTQIMCHNFGQKKTKRDIVTVCNSCIILSVLSKQKLETMCQDKIVLEAFRRCARTKILRKLLLEII